MSSNQPDAPDDGHQYRDLVELRDGAAWLGSVLDVVDGRPRCLLVYWYTPPKLCINPVLENEDCLAFSRDG